MKDYNHQVNFLLNLTWYVLSVSSKKCNIKNKPSLRAKISKYTLLELILNFLCKKTAAWIKLPIKPIIMIKIDKKMLIFLVIVKT